MASVPKNWLKFHVEKTTQYESVKCEISTKRCDNKWNDGRLRLQVRRDEDNLYTIVDLTASEVDDLLLEFSGAASEAARLRMAESALAGLSETAFLKAVAEIMNARAEIVSQHDCVGT
jgi:hypothetical protein